MARREVIEVVCDRCNRTDIQPKDERDDALQLELAINFHGEEHRYEDLCRRCRDAVKNYFLRITKQSDEEDEKKEEQPKKKGFLPSLASG